MHFKTVHLQKVQRMVFRKIGSHEKFPLYYVITVSLLYYVITVLVVQLTVAWMPDAPLCIMVMTRTSTVKLRGCCSRPLDTNLQLSISITPCLLARGVGQMLASPAITGSSLTVSGLFRRSRARKRTRSVSPWSLQMAVRIRLQQEKMCAKWTSIFNF